MIQAHAGSARSLISSRNNHTRNVQRLSIHPPPWASSDAFMSLDGVSWFMPALSVQARPARRPLYLDLSVSFDVHTKSNCKIWPRFLIVAGDRLTMPPASSHRRLINQQLSRAHGDRGGLVAFTFLGMWVGTFGSNKNTTAIEDE